MHEALWYNNDLNRGDGSGSFITESEGMFDVMDRADDVIDSYHTMFQDLAHDDYGSEFSMDSERMFDVMDRGESSGVVMDSIFEEE